MTHAERRALRKKHEAWGGVCFQCHVHDRCDVTRVLDYLDLVDPMGDER